MTFEESFKNMIKLELQNQKGLIHYQLSRFKRNQRNGKGDATITWYRL